MFYVCPAISNQLDLRRDMKPTDNVVSRLIGRFWAYGPFKGRLFLVDHLLRFCRYAPTKYGPVVRVRRRDWTNRAAIFGVYGVEISDQIRTLSPGDTFLDIGANTGIFSLIASAVVTDGLVFAFEPNPKVYVDLCENIRVNGASNVISQNLALSDTDGIMSLEIHEGHSGTSSIRGDGNGPRVVVVAPANLKALSIAMAGQQAGIKIDVEGHELHVLRGLHAARLLDRSRWIIVEIDSDNLEQHGASVAGVYDFLEPLGFRPQKGRIDSGHYDEIFVQTVD